MKGFNAPFNHRPNPLGTSRRQNWLTTNGAWTVENLFVRDHAGAIAGPASLVKMADMLQPL